MYRLRALNHVDALTRREQDTDKLALTKASLRMQILLKPKQLDLRIQSELVTNASISAIRLATELDLIKDVLQVN
jgi:hypothetical protein